MKKTLPILLAVLAIACAKEPAGNSDGGNTLFNARFGEAPAVRTALSGTKVLWTADDEITLFWNDGYTTAKAASAGETTTFPATVGTADVYYAVYPSSVPASFAAGALTLTVPAAQHGSFAEANLAVARTTDKTLSFKNLCGLGKFTLSRDDIAEVRFAGAGQENICGEAEIDIDDSDIPSFGDAAGKEIVLTPASGSAFAAGTYYFAVIPSTLSSGIAFTLKTSGGESLPVKSSTKRADLVRSRILNFGTIDGESSGGNPVPAEGAELECTNPPTEGTVSPTTPYGYGAGVTGGDAATSANILHFDNGKALQTWLLARTKSEKNGDHSPVTIWLSGTFGPTDGRDFSEAHPWFDVKDVSNLSFYGTDSFVMDRIGLFCVRASNIIIRNINFRQPKANNGADAVSMQECDGVWVDHCTFTSLNQTKDYEDGSTDITHESKNVTVSWCRYIKTQKSCLVGHSNSASADAAITATFHHNWFDGSSSRHPRVRFGKVHVYNNLYDGCTTYGVGSAYGARVLVEYNYFDGVQLPTDICTYPAKESNESNLQGSVAGYLYATQDVFVNRPDKAKDPYPLTNVKYTSYNGGTITPLTYNDFKPAYEYIVTPAADVPAVVKAGAGYGKLNGFAEAPVAVNNGGITEFDGTPDTPDDPEPDDPDDPVIDDGSAHTFTLYVNDSKKIIATKDGVEGSSYFTSSTSLSDFSKDYGQTSFTIGGTAYKYGLKMDSRGSVVFSTSSTCNTTVQFYFARRKSTASGVAMQLIPAGGEAVYTGNSEHTTYTDSGQISLQKNTQYTICQVSGESGLILVIVRETE